nr:reverse transcriptase domain-containing protein [Tanacetum cinerariifolium]
MLAPSGGGLILYQAYGNLYSMIGRKSHLLEDKQIPSVWVFDEVSFYTISRPQAIPNHTWRHSHSYVFDDLPVDGYDQNDVQRLCARIICLREIKEEVLVHSEMSIYDFMTLPSWGDAKFFEELHHLPIPLLDRVPQHTTTPTAEGALIMLPTPDERKLRKRASEVGSSASEVEQVEGLEDASDFWVDLKNSLERTGSTPVKAVSAPTPHLGKRLGPPPFSSFVTVSESLKIDGSTTGGFAGKPRAEDDDFATASRGEEIDLTLFPFALGPYILNNHYSNLVNHKSRTQEKFYRKTKYVKELRSEVTDLDKEVEKAQGDCSVLAQENRELCSPNEASSEERLLSSDEFHAALAHVVSLGIATDVEKGLRSLLVGGGKTLCFLLPSAKGLDSTRVLPHFLHLTLRLFALWAFLSLQLGDEGLSSGGTKPNSIFITAEFKSKSSHIKGVPSALRISAFMHGHGHLELAKKLNDKIPKMVDEMFKRVRAFIKGEVAAGSAEMVHPSQRDKWYIHLAWTEGPKKARNKGGLREARRNMWVYTPYPRKDTFTLLIKTLKEILAMENKIEEVVASGKLAHLVKDIRRTNQRNESQGRNSAKVINMIREGGNRKRSFEEGRFGLTNELTFPTIPQNQLKDEPIILEGIIKETSISTSGQDSEDEELRW